MKGFGGARLVWQCAVVLGFAFGLLPDIGLAQSLPERPTLNFSGVPGLIDMPSGQAAPDAEFSLSHSSFGGLSRTTLGFQLTPRLGGSFRYVAIKDWNFGGFATYYDRNFDLRFRVLDEGRILPSLSIGLQDFVGTGLYAAEYLAMTKTLTPRLRVTAGLGWGRLGTYNSIGAPFGPRPPINIGRGGKPNTNQWFRGPAAPFAGVEWALSDRIGLKAEYSSDAYDVEARQRGVFRRRSPWNFGLEYQATPSLRFGAYYLYGTEVGVTASLAVDPKQRPRNQGIQGPAPLPIKQRPDPARLPEAWSQDWASAPDPGAALRPVIAQALALDGMALQSLALSGDRVQLRMRNHRLDSEAQAIGRAARLLTQVLPPSVEIFEIVPVVDGIALSKVTLRRSDLEALEFVPNASAQLRRRVLFEDAGRQPGNAVVPDDVFPRFAWSLSPYTRLGLFDPSNPVRADIGVRLSGRYEIAPGFILSASVLQKLAGNLGSSTRLSNSVLPRVRTDIVLYDREGTTALETLTLAWMSRPARNLYGRVTVGYLERMFGGISTELLWKPVEGRLALGAELNFVRQRDYDQLLGFRGYDVLTGHASAYYDLGKGYVAQLDVGRYLAGDVGATISLDREFDNGWKVGAFATFTNVSARRFGEGSFDKGIRFTIPLAWVSGSPSRKTYPTTIRPVTRDGGAKLIVDGRLYETVRSYHAQGLDAQWGRVFR